MSETVEVGVCDLCGQELLRTVDDCWHPYNVQKACPPEPPGTSGAWAAWFQAGNRTGRPGRQHWKTHRMTDHCGDSCPFAGCRDCRYGGG